MSTESRILNALNIKQVQWCGGCGARVDNPKHGCLTCGPLVAEVFMPGTFPGRRAVQAAQESAEAVIAVKRFLDAMDDGADDHLNTIRRQVHAPMYAALNKALDKMIEEPLGHVVDHTDEDIKAVWEKPDHIPQADWDHGDQIENVVAAFDSEPHRFIHGGHSGEHLCRVCGEVNDHINHQRPS